MTVGGIPLIYLGDEIATLNDYSYQADPAHARDSRWVHRPQANWEKYAKRNDPDTIEGRVFQEFQKLIRLRREHSAFSAGELEIVATGNEHVLGYQRMYEGNCALIIVNFSEQPQRIALHLARDNSVYTLGQIHGASQMTLKGPQIIEPLDFVVFEITS
jgi:glycosidase